MSGAASRRKGHDWERDLVRVFQRIFPRQAVRRGLQQARDGTEVPDIECPLFWVEAKVGRRVSPLAALAQAELAMGVGSARIPLAVCKQDRCRPTVTLRLSDFERLCEKFVESELETAQIESSRV